MDEFRRQGGSINGREERSDAFQGEPKAVGGALGGTGARGTTSLTDPDPSSHSSHGHHSGSTNHGTTTGSGLTGTSSTSHDGTHKKPSLMDKLNPKKDTDGDGKSGIMD